MYVQVVEGRANVALTPAIISDPWTGKGMSQKISHPCTWVWSLKYLPLSDAVLLEEDFLAAETWFPRPQLFSMLSGMFVWDAAPSALINQIFP